MRNQVLVQADFDIAVAAYEGVDARVLIVLQGNLKCPFPGTQKPA
jgi:hypothetical protein